MDFSNINEEQRSAIEITEGPLLIIAGPGTGKTFTLVKRIAYLVVDKGVKPSEIMVVTFTDKAARELLTRISNEFSILDFDININEMYIGTFHSICLRLLKENAEYLPVAESKRMLDAFEQNYIVCRNIDKFKYLNGYDKFIKKSNDEWKQAQEICRYVNLMMEELVDIDAMENDKDEDVRFVARLVKRYLELLEKNKVMDFSSIQTEMYQMLITYPEVLSKIQNDIHYIMVDEYQDTNYIQEQIVFLIAGEKLNICVVGDDDQGMYRFRGATIRNILEFPDKAEFGRVACKRIYLNKNYRSEQGIIDFYNSWMENVDNINLFNWDKYRYPKSIVGIDENHKLDKAVYVCGGDDEQKQLISILHMIKQLMKDGNIEDYNQIAFLFTSVRNSRFTNKQSEAMAIASFLEKNGIPVYSPRSRMFFERNEIKQILGCLIMVFPKYFISLAKTKSFYNYPISEELIDYYMDCAKSAKTILLSNAELKSYIQSLTQSNNNIQVDSEEGLLDIFYKLLSFEPFAEMLNADFAGNATTVRAARNLSEISRLIAKFNHLHDMHSITHENIINMPEEFFNVFLKYHYIDGIGEYEDESEYAPSGCISFMTIHQSKGLEFPVVLIGSLGKLHRREKDTLLLSVENRFFHRRAFEPLEDIKYFDFWRLFYVAFSRAQNLLLLSKQKEENRYFENYIKSIPNVEDFRSTIKFATVKKIKYKKVYSFTSHIAVYDGCPRQYKFYKEYSFAQNRMFQTSVGSLVHATLEDMNKCVIAGNISQVNEEEIKKWFELNYQNMQETTGYHLEEEQKENALMQVIRYYRHRKDELGKVWKSEEEINLVLDSYILQGVIDLVEGLDDTVEIVDYKTGPKPDVIKRPSSVEHYKKQLEIYAYLIEKRYNKKISKMHLYYTSTLEGSPLVSFVWNRQAVDAAIEEVGDTVSRIEKKEFENDVQNSYACEYCDMRYLCGKCKVM